MLAKITWESSQALSVGTEKALVCLYSLLSSDFVEHKNLLQKYDELKNLQICYWNVIAT